MEFLTEYSSELMLGGSGTLGSILIGVIKNLSKKLSKMNDRITALEKELAINTILDKERAKK